MQDLGFQENKVMHLLSKCLAWAACLRSKVSMFQRVGMRPDEGEREVCHSDHLLMPERIYNPITAMAFLAMFTFQLDNTKR